MHSHAIFALLCCGIAEELVVGQTYYIVDARWRNAWAKYVGVSSLCSSFSFPFIVLDRCAPSCLAFRRHFRFVAIQLVVLPSRLFWHAT